MNLGAHMSIAGGMHRALERGRSIGCNAVQLFVQNTSRWRTRKLDPGEIALFRKETGMFAPNFILAHSSYLVNLASNDGRILARSIECFLDEMNRASSLGIPYLVVHPGSHRGAGEAAGLKRIASSLDEILSATGVPGPEILLETTAGQGDSLGTTFDQLACIIGAVRAGGSLGVCFDTCHVFAAGYDLRTKRAYEETIRAFDLALGIERLKAFHVNDSRKELGSRVDRHAHIGEGALGLKAFSFLMNDERFFDRPMVLETPKGTDDSNDTRNLAVLRGLRRASKRRGSPR
ncbi:MAG: deoxyribonuclease IV [Candidatus Krumholzibacteria bacterium]|nr:deoxyribonuclease IV [Candidatus Krumholzibacteria bacterium]